MKKKIIGTIIALVALGLLVGVYFVVSNINTKDAENPEVAEEEIVIVDLSTDSVVNIAYSGALGDVNFNKSSGYWVYPSDSTMPVNQDFVQKIADTFVKVTAKRDITDKGDESAYGFDEPTLVASIMTKGGLTCVFTVGAKNEMSEGYYLKFNDRIYVIDSTIVDATSYGLMDAVKSGTLEVIDAGSITSLTVNGEEVPNKAGYSNIGISSVKDFKDKESYGFDGTESKAVVTYMLNSDVTDENGNVTTTVSTEMTYSFSFAIKDSMTYVMLPDDPCIYNATGTEALFTEANAE